MNTFLRLRTFIFQDFTNCFIFLPTTRKHVDFTILHPLHRNFYKCGHWSSVDAIELSDENEEYG